MLLDPRRFLAGDLVTVHLYLRAIRQWVRKFFDDPSQIDSVVQAAVEEVTRRLRAGEVPEAGRTLHWICNCAHNAVRRELTRVGKTVEPFESHLHGRAPVDMSLALRLRDELCRVEEALDDCEDRARMIFEDRVRGLSYKEIASNYDLGEGAARESVARLRRRVAGELDARDKVEQLVLRARRLGLVRQLPTLPDDSPASEPASR